MHRPSQACIAPACARAQSSKVFKSLARVGAIVRQHTTLYMCLTVQYLLVWDKDCDMRSVVTGAVAFSFIRGPIACAGRAGASQAV